VKDIKLGIIGCGYWGPNLVRNFNECIHTEIRYVCDIDLEKLRRVKLRYPHISITTDYKKILSDDSLHAIVIATPISTHYNLIKESIIAGKDVFVEKPMVSSVKEADEICNLVHKYSRILFVDHIYVYTGAIMGIDRILKNSGIGDIYYFDSVRVNLGLFQHDVNVIWDLAPHDFAIMDFLVKGEVDHVYATGQVYPQLGSHAAIAYITVRFKDDLIAHFHVNWLSPVKIRKIIIGGSKRMIVFDDLDPMEKVKVYDRGVELIEDKKSIYRTRVQYRMGDIIVPHVDLSEALKRAVEDFAESISTRKQPLTDCLSGLRVVRLLEASNNSLMKGGVRVRI
jgi:predicted dehydrogenase